MTETTYRCEKHHIAWPTGTECSLCRQEFDSRKPASEMTGEEKVAEFRRWFQVTIGFDKISQRYVELLGRDFNEVELLDTSAIEHELLTGESPSGIQRLLNIFDVFQKHNGAA